jgi:UDP-N-acetylmuramyl pentapeptide phosphotransferase/UDP-N-acetylglucosamine-1-phosphate transferase
MPGIQGAPLDPALLLPVASGAGVIVVVALWDDFGHVSPIVRLFSQFFAAWLLLGQVDHVGILVGIFLSLCVVWSINLYNFMDGMDGLAASMSIVGFGTLGVIGLLGHQMLFAYIMFSVVSAVSGFLVFNLPPARIFMGDVGSTFLGYIMATASLWGIDRGIFPFWVPLLVFLPFWLDATLTLLRRLARGERVWEAHCSHFYQRAVLSGMTVRKVLFIEVVFMLTCAILAISGWFLWVSGR